MLHLRRTSSSSSCSCTSSANSLTTATTQQISRKRVSAAQLKALKAMYDAKSHPSREERLALSAEIGMELKSVTIWLQNRRQTAKKNARALNENTPPDNDLQPASGRRSRSSPTLRTTTSPRLRAHISLDHIARLSERASGEKKTAALSPLTTRSINVRNLPAATTIDKSDLWQHMPSSPIASPSSPDADTARLSILPSRSRTMRSLEWACAKARVTGIRDEESESDSIPTFHLDRPSFGQEADDLYDTETEIDEAITPDTSADISPVISAVEYKDCQSRVGKGLSRQQGENGSDVYTSGDVEAAMVLLGFMSRA